MSKKVQVKITVEKETTPEQKEELSRIADYTARRVRYVVNEDDNQGA